MKRTLRIEVIRYSRSSTVITDEVALETHLAEKQPPMEKPLQGGSEVQSAETYPPELAGAKEGHFVPRFRLLSFLKQLIQG